MRYVASRHCVPCANDDGPANTEIDPLTVEKRLRNQLYKMLIRMHQVHGTPVV